MNKNYDIIVAQTLTLLAFRFRKKLIKSGIEYKTTGEALCEILKILDKSMDEIEQEMHENFEIREKGDKKDA